MAKRLRRILLTNDDGVDAPGLKVLEEVANELADDVWVVAPDHDQSGISHSLSLHAPLRVSRKDARRFSVSGTPGDCVVMAVRHLMDEPPELILSGINRGANIGVETVFSGTVGAAMTGMLLGIPSMALSQAFSDRDNIPWSTARSRAPDVIRMFAGGSWSAASCLNINFPDCAAESAGEVVLTTQGRGHLDDVQVVAGTDPRKLDYFWLSLSRSVHVDADSSEASAVAAGKISVTPLEFERTSRRALADLIASRGCDGTASCYSRS
ncbi:5'/3'-nucleotidase SurE [Rhizobium sp. GR12]|uniref:5'/3'-nucleotidase SurE n=1 Tax=Rhizobium sp. GR12 TaxID=3053925 RepID=UPI002FBEDEEF